MGQNAGSIPALGPGARLEQAGGGAPGAQSPPSGSHVVEGTECPQGNGNGMIAQGSWVRGEGQPHIFTHTTADTHSQVLHTCTHVDTCMVLTSTRVHYYVIQHMPTWSAHSCAQAHVYSYACILTHSHTDEPTSSSPPSSSPGMLPGCCRAQSKRSLPVPRQMGTCSRCISAVHPVPLTGGELSYAGA